MIFARMASLLVGSKGSPQFNCKCFNNLNRYKSFFVFICLIRKARTRFTYELFLAIDY